MVIEICVKYPRGVNGGGWRIKKWLADARYTPAHGSGTGTKVVIHHTHGPAGEVTAFIQPVLGAL